MSASPASTRATVIPCLHYRDAYAAIDFLCNTFGFTKQLVVPGENNTVRHAQLSFGNGMIMLGSTGHQDNPYGQLIAQLSGETTVPVQSTYVIVADADVVYASARAAGLPMVVEIRDEDHGGRSFTCRDHEGHIWSFGTYDPFA